jgi:hypothetical protein
MVAQASINLSLDKIASYPGTGTHLLGVNRTSRGLEIYEIDLGASKITWTSPLVFDQTYSSDYQKRVDVVESASGLHLRIISGPSAVIAW